MKQIFNNYIGATVGLAEWIIDDPCLLFFTFSSIAEITHLPSLIRREHLMKLIRFLSALFQIEQSFFPPLHSMVKLENLS